MSPLCYFSWLHNVSEELPHGQSAQRAIAEAKQRSQRPVIGRVTKIYYLELKFQRRLTSGRRPVAKTIAESLSQHDKKHVEPTPLSGIGVEKRKHIISPLST
jgi:hypothetical protein